MARSCARSVALAFYERKDEGVRVRVRRRRRFRSPLMHSAPSREREDACYSYETYSASGSPLLPSLERAYVLTTAAARPTRLAPHRLAELRRLCGTTVVQINSGFVSGAKRGVKGTATDLCHAYRQAFRHAVTCSGPVLVLEDDAQLMQPNDTPERAAAFAAVDAFVGAPDAQARYDVYSLGSAGPFDRSRDVGGHRRFRGLMGFSQAVVWTAHARAAVLASHTASRTVDSDVHIDVHTLSRFGRKYTWHEPLVVQLFPTTANMSEWCIACDGSVWEKPVVRCWQGFLQHVLKLDDDPAGWKALYALNANAETAVATAKVAIGGLVLVMALVAVASWAHRSRCGQQTG